MFMYYLLFYLPLSLLTDAYSSLSEVITNHQKLYQAVELLDDYQHI